MKKYEIMTIVSGSLGDEKAKTFSKDIQSLITTQKGSVEKSDFWGKRKFAYEIEGEKEGYYNVITFELAPEALEKVTGKLKLMDGIVRYLITAQS